MRAILLSLCLAAATSAGAQEAFSAQRAVDESILKTIAGRADLSQAAISDQSATVAGNSVSGTSTTGTIAIDDQAFQNLAGFAVISANTGNNVAINASMNVNISITTP